MKPFYLMSDDKVRAIASHRSGVLRTEPVPVSALRAPAVIAGPARSFIELTRNIELAERAPRRFEPTVKEAGDVVI
jgi:hypothetical protein